MTSSNHLRKWIYPVIACMTSLALIYFILRYNSVKKESVKVAAEKDLLQHDVGILREIIHLDTLILKDQYMQALEQVERLQSSIQDDSLSILFPMHLRMIAYIHKNWQNSQVRPNLPALNSLASSSGQPNGPPDSEVEDDSLYALQNRLDSMAFALQKAEVIADKLQLKVDENTAGNYLSFMTRKGNSVYYVGDIQEDKANGLGVGVLSTGSRYEGEWKDNQKHGKGVFEWQDGAIYDGLYREDLRHGMGTYHWPNGERFEGMWERDVRSGEGTFYNADGKVVATGLWRDDELVKRKKKK